MLPGYDPLTADLREMVYACLYLEKTGFPWRYLPTDFGLWSEVAALLTRAVRQKRGRPAAPKTAILDSQSVVSGPQAGVRGTDGKKKIRGVKRHVLTCQGNRFRVRRLRLRGRPFVIHAVACPWARPCTASSSPPCLACARPKCSPRRWRGLARLWDQLLLFGPSGTGKSHLAAAIGTALVENDHRVLFTRTTDLIQRLQAAGRDLSLPNLLSKLTATNA